MTWVEQGGLVLRCCWKLGEEVAFFSLGFPTGEAAETQGIVIRGAETSLPAPAGVPAPRGA